MQLGPSGGQILEPMQVVPSSGQLCNQFKKFHWNQFQTILVERFSQVMDSIPWVRCASGNVYLRIWKNRSFSETFCFDQMLTFDLESFFHTGWHFSTKENISITCSKILKTSQYLAAKHSKDLNILQQNTQNISISSRKTPKGSQ